MEALLWGPLIMQQEGEPVRLQHFWEAFASFFGLAPNIHQYILTFPLCKSTQPNCEGFSPEPSYIVSDSDRTLKGSIIIIIIIIKAYVLYSCSNSRQKGRVAAARGGSSSLSYFASSSALQTVNCQRFVGDTSYRFLRKEEYCYSPLSSPGPPPYVNTVKPPHNDTQ